MRIVYFITDAELKKYTPLNLNVDDSFLNKAILDAQLIKIKQELGSELYNKIEDLYISGMTESENINYKILFDEYIYMTVIHWSLVEILPFVRYKLNNKGVNTQYSENTESVEFEEFKYLQSLLVNKAEFYSSQMKKFIKKNITDYPEYYSSENCGEISPTKSSYFSGIEFY